MRSCVCEICTQLEFRLKMIFAHRNRAEEGRRREYEKLTLQSKVRLMAGPVASATAANAADAAAVAVDACTAALVAMRAKVALTI